MQNSAAWHRHRMGRFTGSTASLLLKQPRSKADREAGKLAGATQTLVRSKLWEDLTDPSYTPPDFDTLATKWGHENEPLAIETFEAMTGHIVRDGGFFAGERIGASPDGLIYGEDDEVQAVVEVKCPFAGHNLISYRLAHDEDLPEDYQCQLQWNMLLADANTSHFIAYDPRLLQPFTLHVRHIAADAARQHALLDGLERALEALREMEDRVGKPRC